MALKVYNSLSRQREDFVPITPGHVGLYVCGPTVSGESHLGHARPFITFDIVYRYLTFLGNKVRYVRNITDAGHFEEEGREAEDKIAKKAILEKLEPMELVQKYTNLFHWAMHQFNNLDPTIEPTATGHIVEQIVMIEKIIADGYAYVANGSVYFDVEKYHKDFGQKGIPYGILSGRILDEQLETTRELESQEEKRNKSDFALWKHAAPEHIMRWKSPWGEGFPGWHIECSAMAASIFKKYPIDIHTGGVDLRFPHHDNEIAQSEAYYKCDNWINNFWHTGHLHIEGKKMSKSLKNFLTIKQILEEFNPRQVRFLFLIHTWSTLMNYSTENSLPEAVSKERKFTEFFRTVKALIRNS